MRGITLVFLVLQLCSSSCQRNTSNPSTQIYSILHNYAFVDDNGNNREEQLLKGLELCDQYLASNHDTLNEQIRVCKLNFLWLLNRKDDYWKEADRFILDYPESNQTFNIINLKLDLLYQAGEIDSAQTLLNALPDTLYKPLRIKENFSTTCKQDCAATHYRFAAENLFLNKTAPEKSFQTLTGSLDMSSLPNHILFLNFWSQDNIGSKKIKDIRMLYEKYKSVPQFKLINFCLDTDAEKLRSFLKSDPIPGEHILCSFEDALLFGIDAIPGYVIIDQHGRIFDKTTSGNIHRIYDFFYVDGVLSSLIENQGQTFAPRLFELQGDVFEFCGQRDEALYFYQKALQNNPNHIELLLRTAELLNTDKARSDSLFDLAYTRLMNRFTYAKTIRSASAFIFSRELTKHYRKKNQTSRVDSLAKFKEYFIEASPSKKAMRQFTQHMPYLISSLVPIKTEHETLLGLILTRTGYIVANTPLIPTSTFQARIDSRLYTLRHIVSDSLLTLLKLDSVEYMRPIHLKALDVKVDSFFFTSILHNDQVSFCRHVLNDAKINTTDNGRSMQISRKHREKQGGFIFDKSGTCIGFLPFIEQQKEFLTGICSNSIEEHLEKLGYSNIFLENQFGAQPDSFFVLAKPDFQTSDSTQFKFSIPKDGLYAAYARIKNGDAKTDRFHVHLYNTETIRYWTVNNLSKGEQWRPIIFDDQIPQGLSVIQLDAGQHIAAIKSTKRSIDALLITNVLGDHKKIETNINRGAEY